jgi:acetolactate decarboxylase
VKPGSRWTIGFCFYLLIQAGCGRALPAPASPRPGPPFDGDRITQVSIANSLMLAQYDGIMPIPELLRLGDFGLGTLDHLDGEMIVLDGQVYRVRGDGVVDEVGPDRSTPFAIVTRFDPDGEFPCPAVEGLADLEARLDDALPGKNNFLAVRVDGRFASLRLRSVHRQNPPYRPLAEVAKGQSVWTRENQAGTLVGIRSPLWADGLNVPGYHWHFLSDDRKTGGHVLDCRVREGRVRYDVRRDWLIKLDGSAGFNALDLTKDLRRDLRRVESSRGEEAKVDKSGPPTTKSNKGLHALPD